MSDCRSGSITDDNQMDARRMEVVPRHMGELPSRYLGSTSIAEVISVNLVLELGITFVGETRADSPENFCKKMVW